MKIGKDTMILLLLFFIIIAVTFFSGYRDLAIEAGVVGLIVFIIQKKFEYSLSKDIELLKLPFDKQRIKYDKLQTRRVEVIEEFYNLIIVIKFSLDKLIKPGSDENKKKYFDEAGKSLYEFRKKFEKRKLYFNEELKKDIESILNIFGQFYLYAAYYEHKPTIMNEGFQARKLSETEIQECRDRNKKIMDENVPIVLENINKKFKKMLGE